MLTHLIIRYLTVIKFSIIWILHKVSCTTYIWHNPFQTSARYFSQIANIKWNKVKKGWSSILMDVITIIKTRYKKLNIPNMLNHNKLWKILKEMGIPDHLTCLLRNVYACQEATVRTGHGTTDWFQIGKGVCQGCILSPCLFNLYAECIMRNAGLEETQAGSNQDCWEKYQ